MLLVTVHSVTMPVGYSKHAIKSMGRPLSLMAHLKRSLEEVKDEENYLAHVLIMAIARGDNAAKYKAYRQGRKIRPYARRYYSREVSICLVMVGSPNFTVSKNIFATIR